MHGRHIRDKNYSKNYRVIQIRTATRVARLYIFKPKIQIWVNFVVLQWQMLVYCMAFLSILQPFGKFYGHFVYFPQFWYISHSFGIFSPVLVCCTQKNLATLTATRTSKLFVFAFPRRSQKNREIILARATLFDRSLFDRTAFSVTRKNSTLLLFCVRSIFRNF
jgi:hypothetical protein